MDTRLDSSSEDAWRTWPLSEREREYSPSSCVPSIDPYLADYRRDSNEAVMYAPVPMLEGILYGDHPDECFDLFPALGGRPWPLVVYIHGGYWQRLGRVDSRFAGAELAGAGTALAVIEYTLAPAATLDRIVDQCVRAARHLIDNASMLGIDPLRITISGSSAGGHLTAMVAAALRHPFERLIGFSGIYDLEPLVGTQTNQALGLTVAEALRLSPMYLEPSSAPTLLVIGENETSEFHRQHRTYADHLRAYGVSVESRTLAGFNHFDVVSQLAPIVSRTLRVSPSPGS
jgi:arylformamidase